MPRWKANLQQEETLKCLRLAQSEAGAACCCSAEHVHGFQLLTFGTKDLKGRGVA